MFILFYFVISIQNCIDFTGLVSKMDLIKSAFSSVRYIYYDYWEEIADPRISKFALVSSGPTNVLLIIAFYILLVKVIVPRLMQNRDPFSLRKTLIFYNLSLVYINAKIFIHLLGKIDYGRIFLQTKFQDPADLSPEVLEELDLGFWCWMTKFVDLFDTLFFVLRKKDRQITFLHLYHHSFVPILGWMVLKIAPQAPGAKLFLLLNCFVHIVMYLYYGLAAIGSHMQKYLWWKKYLTQLQLTQFVIFIIYGFYMALYQEGYPAGLFWIMFAQSPIFFYMFLSFYLQSYNRSEMRKISNGIHKKE